ncbi:MAG: hypothetical protein AAFZ18_29545, partial [Myxococcota bacterium]
PRDRGVEARERSGPEVAGGAYQLGPDGQFDVIASVRYDTDFGTGFRADTPFGAPIPAVDGRHDVDILFLHLDWRNMIGREFDLRVGRQVHVDDLDFFIFDGLKLIGHLWREGRNHFDLDLFAGSPVRFDAVFGSTEALLGDGTEVYDGETPFGGMALGASAFLRVASHLTLSASWRNEVVFREDEIVGFGPTVVASGPQAGTPFVLGPDLRREAALASAETVGLQVSLLGASIGFELPSIGVALSAGGVVDLLAVRLDQARLGLTWSPQPNLRLELEGFRLRPRFVGDSIFNWFAAFPYDRAQFGVTVEDFGPRLRLRGHWFAQRFTDGDQDDGLHGPSLRLEWRERTVGLHVFSEGGFHFGEATAIGGDWLSAGAGADVTLLGGRLRLDGRVSWAAVGTEDRGLDPSEGATTTLAVGAQGELTHWLRAQTYYAHTFQGLVDGQHRLFVELAARYR